MMVRGYSTMKRFPSLFYKKSKKDLHTGSRLAADQRSLQSDELK